MYCLLLLNSRLNNISQVITSCHLIWDFKKPHDIVQAIDFSCIMYYFLYCIGNVIKKVNSLFITWLCLKYILLCEIFLKYCEVLLEKPLPYWTVKMNVVTVFEACDAVVPFPLKWRLTRVWWDVQGPHPSQSCDWICNCANVVDF